MPGKRPVQSFGCRTDQISEMPADPWTEQDEQHRKSHQRHRDDAGDACIAGNAYAALLILVVQLLTRRDGQRNGDRSGA